MCGGRKRAVRTGLALAVTVSALLAAASPAPAAFPGSNGKIAYVGYGPSGIYRMNPDGSNNELVKGGNVSNPVWSSDGSEDRLPRVRYADPDHGCGRHGLDPGLHLHRQSSRG